MNILEKREVEVVPGKPAKGRFGAGAARYTLVVDSTQAGVEEKYFWVLRFLENRAPYGRFYTGDAGVVMKVKDVYTAGETSAYWGSVEQRRAAQIDKFQQIMANVGNMLKTLFQLLRELRIIDERVEYYERSYKGEDAAEVALKGIWVDLVEGGAKSPGSVFGLALNVGFATLPDLFFSVHPKKAEDVEGAVEKLKEGGFNRKVREVLGRKLKQYMIWKEKTFKELQVGREFKLKYMRQHYQVIKLYLNWLRPYLRNIQRLQMRGSVSDKDVVAAFETSKIELELLAVKRKYEAEAMYGSVEEREFKHFFPCVRVRVNFVAIPEMAFQQEGFQRGALHRGRSEIVVEGFVTTQEDLDGYAKALDEEDLELLKAVDASIVALKDDLEYYLEKAGEVVRREEPLRKETVFSPFTAIASGFKELVGFRGKKSMGGARVSRGVRQAEFGAAQAVAGVDAYLVYKIYKQTHGMFAE